MTFARRSERSRRSPSIGRTAGSRGGAWRNPHLAIITAVYSAAWGLMVLNGGRYWDDWCMVRLSSQGASLMADQMGQIWQRYYWLALSWWPAAEYIFHFVSFALFLVAALSLYGIVRRLPGLDPSAALLVSAVFAVFPVNASRLVQVNLQYTVSLAAFYFGWYLLALDLDRPHPVRRVASTVLFAAAMLTMNSLLVFLMVVPVYILQVRRAELSQQPVRRELAARYGFVLALPVLVWLVRSIALQPSGLYRGYNEIGLQGLHTGLRTVPEAFWKSFVVPAAPALVIGLLVLGIAFAVLRRRDAGMPDPGSDRRLIAVGILAFFLAVFPYLVVEKVPQMVGPDWWDSRHQVLVPLGAALILYGSVTWLVRALRGDRRIVTAVIVAMCAVFVLADVRVNLLFQADWYRQVALMQHIEESADIREGNYFLVHDEAVRLNAFDRRLLPYEFSGMMYRVFGDATRFARDEALGTDYASQLTAYREYEQYHWWAYEEPSRVYLLRITPGTTDVTDLPTLLGLMWSEHFDPDGFDARVHEAIDVETVPLQ